ncbi:tetratricopeptide repeat protein [Actinomadura syzygii]|uniref:Tetratricopeptide repeat protein n=1 Tax=Actinomadura syzygii TaxID=1427538 RepID=A0A5D0U6M8_9ACTN|nr:tetratricopeptide repeat protein [Actinomadura syzygii]TYC13624.1 tetratricopeptide repeat protein [Actinomadura syzygii]
MRANFEDSLQGLPPAAARLFRLLGVLPGGDVGPAAAAALADVPEDEARTLLAALADRDLAAESADGRYAVPGPARALARERAERDETEAGREAALRRVLDHLLSVAGEGGLHLDGLALLERERWSEAADELAERLDAAEHEDDPHGALLARHDLARALIGTGDLDRAIELLGLLPDEFAALPEPDQYNRARALASLGEAYLRAHRPVAATNFFGQALEILRKEDVVDLQAGMFVHLAEAARQRGDRAAEGAALDRAAELYERVAAEGP